VDTVPAVAVKVVDVVPAGTVTDDGTGSDVALLERPTLAPPVDAGWSSETVHVDEPPVPSDVGLQESPERVGSGTVIVPPVPVTEIGPPTADDADKLARPTVVLSAELVIVTVSVATGPLAMVFAFNPASRQVYAPALEEQ